MKRKNGKKSDQTKKEIEKKFDEVGLKDKKEKEFVKLQVSAMESEGNAPHQQGHPHHPSGSTSPRITH